MNGLREIFFSPHVNIVPFLIVRIFKTQILNKLNTLTKAQCVIHFVTITIKAPRKTDRNTIATANGRA